MTYNIEGKIMLFAIDRTQIIDISVNDVLQIDGFPGASYIWTKHDSELVENNPDDEIYLQVERSGRNAFKATGILLK